MVIVNIPIITNNDAYSRVICMFSLKNHACFRASCRPPGRNAMRAYG
jgi:hypothetical protein